MGRERKFVPTDHLIFLISNVSRPACLFPASYARAAGHEKAFGIRQDLQDYLESFFSFLRKLKKSKSAFSGI
jgi:hypothetical protein